MDIDLVQLHGYARVKYDARLPYHNFDHALDVLRRANAIMDRCDAERVPVDRRVVTIACLFHDAGYIRDHRELGYPTKEWYAAELMQQAVHPSRLPMAEIAAVKAVIAATDILAPLRTNEDRVIRAADIGNLCGSYTEFTRATEALKLEAEMLDSRPITWAEWKTRTAKIVGYFLSQDIRLTSGHDDDRGRSVFHSRSQENLERFLTDQRYVDLQRV